VSELVVLRVWVRVSERVCELFRFDVTDIPEQLPPGLAAYLAWWVHVQHPTQTACNNEYATINVVHLLSTGL